MRGSGGYGLGYALLGLLVFVTGCTSGTESSSSTTPDASADEAVAASESTGSSSSIDQSSASSSPSSSSSSSSSTSSSSTTEGDGDQQPAVDGFRSPTGNIHCHLTADGARCSHHGDTPWKAGGALPHWAEGVSFGFEDVGCVNGGFVGFDVAASGLPKATCGDSLYTAPDVTLDYGERLTAGNLSCLSQRFGMTCLNGDGHGFRMATNEVAMLYDRPIDWAATASSTAADRLRPSATTALDQPTKISTESGSATCYLSSFPSGGAEVAAVECRASNGSGNGDGWSPDGRSCAGADFYGYYLNDRADDHRIATFGCTTDVGPLADPREPARAIGQGEAVTIGQITCLSTGPAIVCYNDDGNGMLTAGDEVSFFYRRDL